MRRLCLTFRVDFSVDHSIVAFGEAIQQKKKQNLHLLKKTVSNEGQEKIV